LIRRRLKIDGFKRGYEPVAHRVWLRRSRKLAEILKESGTMKVRELIVAARERFRWKEYFCKNAIAAAEHWEIAEEIGGGRWRLKEPE
jgi:hypothetical protein